MGRIPTSSKQAEDFINKYGFWIGLVLIACVIGFLFFGNLEPKLTDAEKVEEVLTSKGFEYMSSGYYEYVTDDRSVAYIHFKTHRSNSRYHVLSGVQTLYRVYPIVTSYIIKVEINGETCSYSLDGNGYRNFRYIYDDPLWLQTQIQLTEVCE